MSRTGDSINLRTEEVELYLEIKAKAPRYRKKDMNYVRLSERKKRLESKAADAVLNSLCIYKKIRVRRELSK